MLRVGSPSRGSGCRAEREALTEGGKPIRGEKLRGRSRGRHGDTGAGGRVGGLRDSRMWGRMEMDGRQKGARRSLIEAAAGCRAADRF